MRPIVPMLLLLCSCTPIPESYPVPAQHTPVTAPEPAILHSFISMTDPRAEVFLVKGIGVIEGLKWRWTTEAPRLRLHVEDTSDLDVVIDFTVSEVTLKQTGPIRLQVFANDRLIGRETFPQAGDKTFRHPVPSEFLKSNEENELSLLVENPWISPVDGAKLGVLLTDAGFLKRTPVASR